jgi:ubiquinone biosynthesis protein
MSLFADYVRLIHVGMTLARHDVVLPAEYRRRFPLPVRVMAGFSRLLARKSGERMGERLARALEELGPAYVKLGQFLAIRPDVVGTEVAADLSRLKDRMKPFPTEEAEAAVREAFGEDTGKLFSAQPGWLSPAVAAASMAQVHRIETPQGPRALKILRPDIETRITRDISAMTRAAKLIRRAVPASRRLRPVEFVDVVSQALHRELDLRLEAGSASAFAEFAQADGHFEVPQIDWMRTSKRVIALHWAEGTPLTTSGALDRPEADRVALANAITRGFLTSALDHGLFHADMHQGNMILSPTGRLVLVDFGIMGRLGVPERRYLAEILWGFIRRDYRRIAEVHFEAGYVPPHQDVAAFADALRSVGEPIWNKASSDVSMGRVLMQLFDYTELFEMQLRPELVLLQKTMVQVEGVARAIDPQHHIWTAARPILERWIARELGPKARVRKVVEDLKTGLSGLADAIRRREG